MAKVERELNALREKWKDVLQNEGGKVSIEDQVKLAHVETSSYRSSADTPPTSAPSHPAASAAETFVAGDVTYAGSRGAAVQADPASSSSNSLILICVVAAVVFALFLLWSTRSTGREEHEQRDRDDDIAPDMDYEIRKEQIQVESAPITKEPSREEDGKRESNLDKKAQREQVYGKVGNPAASAHSHDATAPNIRLSDKNEDPLFQTLRA